MAPAGQVNAPARSGFSPHQVSLTPPSGQEDRLKVLDSPQKLASNLNL